MVRSTHCVNARCNRYGGAFIPWLCRARGSQRNRIARKNRSARGTAIGDYHSHEHYFANRNRIGNRFHHAQDAQD